MEKETKKQLFTLNVDGTGYKTQTNEMFQRRKPWVRPNEKQIISHIPGTIVKVYVQEGQEVKQGARLYTFDSMKMKNRVMSPLDGKILKIHIQEGQAIPKDSLILEFE
jgi:biotin carboxyl carrier protein